MKKVCILLFLAATASAATCTPPKSMANNMVPNSPLLKFDCEKTKTLQDAYRKQLIKPRWTEVYTGKANSQTAQVTGPIFKALKDKGFKLDKQERTNTTLEFIFRKGKVVLGGELVIVTVIVNPGEYVLAMAGR